MATTGDSGRGESYGLPTPIFTLPNELLALIFSFAAALEPPVWSEYAHQYSKDTEKRRRELLGILRLSEVCMKFRTLLLATPALWASIAFRVPEALSEVAIARSRTSPLSARIMRRQQFKMIFEHDTDRQFALALKHVNRLGSLVAEYFEREEIEQLFCDQLPRLREIRLEQHDFFAEQPTLLEEVCIDAPAVQRARFKLIGMSYVSLLRKRRPRLTFNLPALRSLEIDLLFPHFNTTAELGWIMDILQNATHLEHLRLEIGDTESHVTWEAVFGGRRAQLANLKSLKLIGYATTNLTSLIKHICTARPARCFLELKDPVEFVRPGMMAEDDVESINTFAPMLHHPSYTGLSVRLGIVGNHEGPLLMIATFPAVDDPWLYDFFDLPNEAPDIFQLCIPLPWHEPETPEEEESGSIEYSPIGQQTMKALVQALERNNIKQLAVDATEFRDFPCAFETIAQISATASELIARCPWNKNTSQDFAASATPDGFPPLEAFLDGPVVWDARWSGPRSGRK